MDRQTLRDAVVRYNAKGLEGLHDRPKGYSPRRLTADEEAALAAVIIAGPEPERDGVCAWTRADLCRWLEERFAKTYHPSSMTRVLRRMGFSRQKARPSLSLPFIPSVAETLEFCITTGYPFRHA